MPFQNPYSRSLPTTTPTPPPGTQPPPTRNPYGLVGQLNRSDGTPDGRMPDWLSALPPWLQSQFQFYRNDESGDPRWSMQGNIRDREGREVYQVGDENAWRRQLGSNQDSGVIDPNAIRYDEDLGWVTDPSNIHQEEYNWWEEGFPMLAAVVGAGTLGPYFGLGEGAAGAGAFEGAAATGSLEAGGAAGAAAGAGAPFAGATGEAVGEFSVSELLRGGGRNLLNLARTILGGGNNGGNRYGRNGGGLNMPGLFDLLSAGLGGYMDNRNYQGFRDDINNMINVGTAGVTNDDRRGARDLIRGIYDGSIGGDAIFDRVPGLRAISERGYNDIARRMSAAGDADPTGSARLREFSQFNNELTSRAWNSEMNRAMRIGGYDFDPANMAGRGLQALGTAYAGRQGNSQGIMSQLERLFGGGLGNNLLGGLLNGGEELWDSISDWFDDEDGSEWEDFLDIGEDGDFGF